MPLPKVSTEITRKNFEIFLSKTEKSLNRKQKTNIKEFYTDLNKFAPVFEKTPDTDILVKKANKFAERCVSKGNNNFAGVIYSFLLKVIKQPKVIENIAVKQLAIARRTDDPIHIMARTTDIRKIYQEIAPNSPEHLKWLREEAKSIRRVIKHYEYAKNQYQTIARDVKPIEFYEENLGYVLIYTGEILKNQSPKEAVPILKEAKDIFQKQKNIKAINTVDKIIEQMETKLTKYTIGGRY